MLNALERRKTLALAIIVNTKINMTKKWLIGFVLISVILHTDVLAQKKGKGTIVKDDDYIYKIDYFFIIYE